MFQDAELFKLGESLEMAGHLMVALAGDSLGQQGCRAFKAYT